MEILKYIALGWLGFVVLCVAFLAITGKLPKTPPPGPWSIFKGFFDNKGF